MDSRLESFDYEVQYVQGSANSVADYLSRLDSEVDLDVNNEDEYFGRHIFSISDGELDMNKIRDDQYSDPAISFVVRQLEENGFILHGRFKNQRGMHLRQGLLYRRQFYWKGIHGDIHDFCEECLVCHRNKRKCSPKEELVPIDTR